MPHFVFIINPAAGKGAYAEGLCQKIRTFFEAEEQSYELFLTTGAGDAFQFVKSYAHASSQELCFVACGGDGTLHEVVNGAVGRDDCTVSVIPCGSGNDYVKNFGDPAAFTDLKRLTQGYAQWVDLLDCSGDYAINLCNIGFDARVAHNMNKFKRWPLVSGQLAYTLSILYCILGAISSNMTITLEDGRILKERLILAVIANGFCYGGGYYPVPNACTVDGKMEFCGVRKMSRLKISQFIRIYKAGQHLTNPALADKILFEEGKSLSIESKQPLVVCLDGETRLTHCLSVALKPAALRVWLPSGTAACNQPALANTPV